MTNLLALLLSLTVIAVIAYDLWQGGAGVLFAVQQFARLVEWVAFYR